MVGNAGELSSTASIDYAPMSADLKQMFAQIANFAKQSSAVVQQITQAVNKGPAKAFQNLNKNVWTVYGNIKDIFRVATGILMARAINSLLRGIMNCTRALWDFNQIIESTELSLTYLLGTKGVEAVNAFTDSMKKLAAQTPYTYEGVVDATRILLRFGYTEKMVLPMVRILADMGAAAGLTADRVNDLTYAIGKVLAKGRLYSVEAIRQIGSVVPIAQILKEKLGITLQDLRTLNVPAAPAIKAIFSWVEEHYAGAAARMEKTTKGLLSSIHDYLLFLAQDIFKGLFDRIRATLTTIRDRLAELWEIFKQYGLEGLIAAMFPPNIALAVWQLIKTFREMWLAIVRMWKVTASFRQELMNLAITLVSWISKAMLIITHIMERLTNIIFRTTSVVRILSATLVGLAVASMVAKSLNILIGTIALLFSTSFGVVKILSILAGVLVALALTIPSIQRWFSNLGNTILKAFGIQIPASIMTTKAAIAGLSSEQYTWDFSNIIEGFNDIEDSAEEAGKEIEDTFIAAFDEVYQIPKKLGAADKVLADLDLENWVPPDFSLPEVDLGLDAIEEELGDFVITWSKVWEGIKIVAKGVWGAIKIIAKGIWDTLVLTVPKVLQTLPTLIAPIVKTITTIFAALIQTISIILPRAIMTLSLIVTTLVNSILTYGLDKIAKFGWEMFKILVRQIGSINMMMGALGARIGYALAIGIKDSFIEAMIPFALEVVEAAVLAPLRILSKIPRIGWAFNLPLVTATRWFDKQKGFFVDLAKSHEDYNIEESILWKETEKIIDFASKDLESAYSEMNDLLINTSKDFIKETLPIWQQLGKDIIVTWEGTGKELVDLWGPALNDVKDIWITWVNASGKPIWSGFGRDLKKIWGGVGSDLADIATISMNNLGSALGSGLDNVINIAEEKAKRMASVIGIIRSSLSSLYATISAGAVNPTIIVPTIPTPNIIGPTGLPYHLQQGGIVMKNAIAQLGEHGTKEVVTPLTPQGIEPWANAIVSAMQTGRTMEPISDYVLVRLKKSDLVNLQRQFFTIQKQEAARVSGRS